MRLLILSLFLVLAFSWSFFKKETKLNTNRKECEPAKEAKEEKEPSPIKEKVFKLKGIFVPEEEVVHAEPAMPFKDSGKPYQQMPDCWCVIPKQYCKKTSNFEAKLKTEKVAGLSRPKI